MRRLAFCAALLLPLTLNAAKVETQAPEWTQCQTDDDCVVIKGVCYPAAVRAQYKADAEIFFRQRAAETKCVPKFWEPAPDKAAARCRLERCEIVGKE